MDEVMLSLYRKRLFWGNHFYVIYAAALPLFSDLVTYLSYPHVKIILSTLKQ